MISQASLTQDLADKTTAAENADDDFYITSEEVRELQLRLEQLPNEGKEAQEVKSQLAQSMIADDIIYEKSIEAEDAVKEAKHLLQIWTQYPSAKSERTPEDWEQRIAMITEFRRTHVSHYSLAQDIEKAKIELICATDNLQKQNNIITALKRKKKRWLAKNKNVQSLDDEIEAAIVEKETLAENRKTAKESHEDAKYIHGLALRYMSARRGVQFEDWPERRKHFIAMAEDHKKRYEAAKIILKNHKRKLESREAKKKSIQQIWIDQAEREWQEVLDRGGSQLRRLYEPDTTPPIDPALYPRLSTREILDGGNMPEKRSYRKKQKVDNSVRGRILRECQAMENGHMPSMQQDANEPDPCNPLPEGFVPPVSNWTCHNPWF